MSIQCPNSNLTLNRCRPMSTICSTKSIEFVYGMSCNLFCRPVHIPKEGRFFLRLSGVTPKRGQMLVCPDFATITEIAF